MKAPENMGSEWVRVFWRHVRFEITENRVYRHMPLAITLSVSLPCNMTFVRLFIYLLKPNNIKVTLLHLHCLNEYDHVAEWKAASLFALGFPIRNCWCVTMIMHALHAYCRWEQSHCLTQWQSQQICNPSPSKQTHILSSDKTNFVGLVSIVKIQDKRNEASILKKNTTQQTGWH